jgi:ABC-type sulfate transport system permease subunit
MAFTHTLGEFGVVLMVGGNIPGKYKDSFYLGCCDQTSNITA